jgi:hypothetical protein
MTKILKAAISRRTCLAGTAALGAGAMFALTGRATAQTKMTQAAAKYQDSPKGSDKCEGCALFQTPDACQGVEGKISPNGWCSIYSPKA